MNYKFPKDGWTLIEIGQREDTDIFGKLEHSEFQICPLIFSI